ncbi:unnamed protein product [Auanema sp. JU1783]|nr:unnamed protein product [Auanema sp. JU1783]
MSFFKRCLDRPEISNAKRFVKNIIHEEDVDYSQFETKIDGTEIVTFRENDGQFRLFRTNVHVKIGAYIACAIGFAITISYCITYTFYHNRGLGRNPFIDQLELCDLIFAFIVGLPCHVLLFFGIRKDNKKLFTPFLVFYLTNFILNCVFTVLTIAAVLMDIHRKIFGNIRYDISWTLFQILFTAAQGLAIYVVMRCRKYASAKGHWKKTSAERNNSSIIADGVTVDA